MKSNYLNELIAASDENVGAKLLQYLMSIRESANLMIMTTSVTEMDWNKSHGALSESFKSKIQGLSTNDQSQLSNFTSIIRYKDYANQCMRGLSITFGRIPESHAYDSTFKNDVDVFIRNLPKAQQGLVDHISLPIIRISLMVHSMRSSLDGSEQLRPLVLEEFALLDFNSQDWRYTVSDGSDQYEVKVNLNDPRRNSFYLRVSKPSKQVSRKYLQPCWIFDNKATGFSFFNIGDLKHLKPLSNKKPVYIHVQKLVNEAKGDNPKQVNEKNIKKLSQSIVNHEIYWSGILHDLLNHANISFKRRAFNSDLEVFIHPKFKGRGFELTRDFLGVDSEGIVVGNKFSLRYFIDPKIYLEDLDEDEQSLIERFNQSIKSILEMHGQLPHAVSLEFNQVFSAHEADLVVGQYDKENSWMSASDLDSVDDYGKKKMSDLKSGIINTQQFISLDVNYSVQMLKRAISECFLKIWLSKPRVVKNITLAEQPEHTSNKYFILSTLRKQQSTKSKPKKYNVFHCCYQVETAGDQLIFSRPNQFSEMGVVSPKKVSDMLNFVDFYYPYSDDKLSQLSDILELIEGSDDEGLIVESISNRYLNNDVTFIFEHNGESIISVWESQNEDLWLSPALEVSSEAHESFTDFIQREVDSNAYTKSEAEGKITQDKRMSKDPHYEVMIDGNRVLIHRKRFNQDQNIGRHILRQFTRIYPSQSLASTGECSFLISGLLSSEAGAYKDSGVAQTIFEKIPSLLI